MYYLSILLNTLKKKNVKLRLLSKFNVNYCVVIIILEASFFLNCVAKYISLKPSQHVIIVFFSFI